MIGKIRILSWIGVVLLFLPFFGMPNAWKVFFAVVIGIALILLSISLRKSYKVLKFKIRRLEQPAAEESIHG